MRLPLKTDLKASEELLTWVNIACDHSRRQSEDNLTEADTALDRQTRAVENMTKRVSPPATLRLSSGFGRKKEADVNVSLCDFRSRS